MLTLDWRPIVGCSPISPGCANCGFIAPLRLDAAALTLPASVPLPALVTVCANSDLFHEDLPDAWIDQVFDIVDAARRHTYRLLTKRADLMRVYLRERYAVAGVPPHVQVGVSAERQAEADDRLSELEELRAAVRYATFYPLLGPIDVTPWLPFLAFVAAGGERERPAADWWFADLARQCEEAGVPFVRGDEILA